MTANRITDKPFVLLVVGELSSRNMRMIDLLKDRYGERLQVIHKKADDEIQGMGIDFVIVDEFFKGDYGEVQTS